MYKRQALPAASQSAASPADEEKSEVPAHKATTHKELPAATDYDELIITGVSQPRTRFDVIQSTSVLSQENLQVALMPTLGETLAELPGISSTYFGPGASRPVIRGLDGPRGRVLLNGMGSLDASVMSPDHAVSTEGLLTDRIEPVIDRYDFATVDIFLEDLFPLRSMCEWLRQQYTLDASPEQFTSDTDEEVIETTLELLDQLYRNKEVEFPVTVGINNFLVARQVGGERSDREGLVQWASDRFDQPITMSDIANRQRDQIRAALLDFSERSFETGETLRGEIDELCFNGQPPTNGETSDPALITQIPRITDWVQSSFGVTIDADDWSGLEPQDARQRLLSLYDNRFRPELGQAERSLILEILDTAWKDHLYHMDHLRSGIGLVGYAQKDPKTEYKREGMAAFDLMWERIGEQVTSSIFRIEIQSPEFVGSLWEVSATSHAEAGSVYDEVTAERTESGGPQPGAEVEVIQPIRNTAPRVGRNDPCPCGSGKKFKKCCGSPR